MQRNVGNSYPSYVYGSNYGNDDVSYQKNLDSHLYPNLKRYKQDQYAKVLPRNAQLSPLTPETSLLAERLRTLAPRHLTPAERRGVYGQLMERVAADPGVNAVIENMRQGNTPVVEYVLGYGMVINARGIECILGEQRVCAHEAGLLSVDVFAPSCFIYNDIFTTPKECEQRLAETIGDIAQDLITRFCTTAFRAS